MSSSDYDKTKIMCSLHLTQELFEIFNQSSHPIPLTKWRVFSLTGRENFEFGEGSVLPQFQALHLRSGHGAEAKCTTINDVHWCNRNIWNNAGDVAVLLDASNRVVKIVEQGRPFNNWPKEGLHAAGLEAMQLTLMIIHAGFGQYLPADRTLPKDQLVDLYVRFVVPLIVPAPKRKRETVKEEEPHAKRHAQGDHSRLPWQPSGVPRQDPDAWLWRSPPAATVTHETRSASKTPFSERKPWIPPGTPKRDPDAWLWEPFTGAHRTRSRSGGKLAAVARTLPLPRVLRGFLTPTATTFSGAEDSLSPTLVPTSLNFGGESLASEEHRTDGQSSAAAEGCIPYSDNICDVDDESGMAAEVEDVLSNSQEESPQHRASQDNMQRTVSRQSMGVNNVCEEALPDHICERESFLGRLSQRAAARSSVQPENLDLEPLPDNDEQCELQDDSDSTSYNLRRRTMFHGAAADLLDSSIRTTKDENTPQRASQGSTQQTPVRQSMVTDDAYEGPMTEHEGESFLDRLSQHTAARSSVQSENLDLESLLGNHEGCDHPGYSDSTSYNLRRRTMFHRAAPDFLNSSSPTIKMAARSSVPPENLDLESLPGNHGLCELQGSRDITSYNLQRKTMFQCTTPDYVYTSPPTITAPGTQLHESRRSTHQAACRPQPIALPPRSSASSRSMLSTLACSVRRNFCLLSLWLVVMTCAGWVLCWSSRPQPLFCDTEGCGAAEIHSDCLPCQPRGFCAQGRLWACETGTAAREQCVTDWAAFYTRVLRRHAHQWRFRLFALLAAMGWWPFRAVACKMARGIGEEIPNLRVS